MHTLCARPETEGRELCQALCMEAIVEWTARITLYVVGMTVMAAMMVLWCMFVFVLSGRLPWMVRKYF